MSYQVLARKWRPKSFEQLVGQQQTATALSNALETQRLHHAYLFTGTRGVGKTTIARILSKSLNCEQGISPSPCGECASCVEIDQGNFVDLMEIDAASKTKVEDTRELLDNVQYRPTRGRYKVYLIDEVHMLSGHSFNALLKTLEEPPPHVVFLLATTDPQKLPVTVLSRCLQFHLRRMEEQQIVDHLSKILQAEALSFESDALWPIAKGADGSMRDALSLLDQAIAYSGQKVTKAAVLEMLGSIDQNFCIRLLQLIQQDDAQGVMALVKEMAQFSPDFIEVMSDWLNLLHRLAVIQATDDQSNSALVELASQVNPADLQLYYQLSLQAKKDLPYAPHPRQGFEMAMLRVLAFRPKPTNATPSHDSGNSQQVKKKQTNLVDTESEANASKPVHPAVTVKTEPNLKLVNSSDAPNIIAKQNDEIAIESQHRVTAQGATQVSNRLEVVGQTTHSQEVKSFDAKSSVQAHSSAQKSLGPVVSNEVVSNEVVSNESDPEKKLTEQNADQKNTSLKTTDFGDSLKDGEVPKIQQPTERLGEPETNNSSHTSQAQTETKVSKLPYHERPLYPDEAQLELTQITEENWHIAVDQMRLRGNGQQVLINSLGSFNNQRLEIRYLKQVEHFLTENLNQSLIKTIRKYFKQPQLPIIFETIESIDLSPKDRQVKVHQQALEAAYQDLQSNSCVAVLQQSIGATIDKSTIELK